MAFIIEPDQDGGNNGSGGGGKKRRPDVRPGKKTLAIIGMEYGTSRAGNPKIDTCWVVIEDPDGGTDVGAIVFDSYALTQRAAWKVQQVAGAVGQKTSWDAEDPDETWKVFSQAPVTAEIKMEPKWNGDGEKASIDRYSRSSFEITEQVDAMIVETEGWYNEWSAKKKKGGGSRPSSGGGSNYVEDDIPF